MNNEEYPIRKHALQFGGLLALALILFSLLLFVLDLSTNRILGMVNYVILFAGILISSIYYRNKHSGGYIEYGKSLLVGFLTGLCASVLLAVYTYFYLKYLGLNIEQILSEAEQRMVEANPSISDEQIEKGLEWARKFTTPLLGSITGLLFNSFFSFIFALIASIFVKKEDTSLRNNVI